MTRKKQVLAIALPQAQMMRLKDGLRDGYPQGGIVDNDNGG